MAVQLEQDNHRDPFQLKPFQDPMILYQHSNTHVFSMTNKPFGFLAEAPLL